MGYVMKWEDVESQICSVARALSIVGERWTLLIVRDIFMGYRRFDELQSSLGITRHRLSERLNKLVEKGVLVRVAYQEKPTRFEYRLTRMGLGLYPVLMSLTRWGDDWLDDGKGAPVEYLHKKCGMPMRPVLSCNECRDVVHPENVVPKPGKILKSNNLSSTELANVPVFLRKLDSLH